MREARTREYIRKTLGVLAAVVLCAAGAVSFAPGTAYARPIAYTDLTAANHWTCTGDFHNKSCTKTDGSTATCQFFGGADGGNIGSQWICDAVDGTTGDHTTSVDTTVGGTSATTDASTGETTIESHSVAGDAVAAGAGIVGNAVLGTVLAPVAILMWAVFKIASLLLGLAGIVFNWVVAALVFDFAKYLGNSPGMLVAWGILRDFGNIGLLFGFVFMGISTILDLHSYPWKKALPALVIFAVLLNFSLFAAEAVVDSANVLSATLYDQTNNGQVCRGADWLGCFVNTGIAGQLLERLNITSTYDESLETTGNLGASAATALNQFINPLDNILKFTALALVTTVAAVVLFAGALMLLSRAVILAFLMVTSPIGFAGMAIPGLNKLAKDWWHKLLNQALFAPVFILLLLVALKMSDGVNQLASAGGLAGALSPTNAGSTGTLLVFFLIIGFMVGALMLASKFGIYGADFATKAAGGAVYGTMGYIGRRTVGAAANRLQSNILKSRFGTTIAGKTLAGVAGIGASGSMDFRGTGVFKGAKVDLGKTSDVGKKGRAGELKDAAEKEDKYATSLKKARDGQDKGFKAEQDELKRKEDLALANADIAERRRNPEEAQRQRGLAAGFAAERAQSEFEHAQVKKDRLSVDDRKIQGYYNRTVGDAQQAEQTAGNQMAAAATAMAEATARFTAAEERIAALRTEQGGIGGRNQAEIDADMRFAEAQRETAQRAQETAEIERTTAEQNRENAHRDRELFTKRAAEYNKKTSDPKYAMEQYARTLQETSKTILGHTVLDSAKLRAGAAGIRAEAGKDPKLAAFEHLLHEMHDDHGPAAHPPTAPAPAAPAAPGGDAHPPAAAH